MGTFTRQLSQKHFHGGVVYFFKYVTRACNSNSLKNKANTHMHVHSFLAINLGLLLLLL